MALCMLQGCRCIVLHCAGHALVNDTPPPPPPPPSSTPCCTSIAMLLASPLELAPLFESHVLCACRLRSTLALQRVHQHLATHDQNSSRCPSCQAARLDPPLVSLPFPHTHSHTQRTHSLSRARTLNTQRIVAQVGKTSSRGSCPCWSRDEVDTGGARRCGDGASRGRPSRGECMPCCAEHRSTQAVQPVASQP
jgi:hypothetical protein